jgi:hypothetical protein
MSRVMRGYVGSARAAVKRCAFNPTESPQGCARRTRK